MDGKTYLCPKILLTIQAMVLNFRGKYQLSFMCVCEHDRRSRGRDHARVTPYHAFMMLLNAI